MSDQKNLILAIVASMAILFGFNYFYEMPRAEKARQLEAQRQESIKKDAPAAPAAAPNTGALNAGADSAAVPRAPTVDASVAPGAMRQAVLGLGPRVRIEGRRVHGSIALTGGRLDDLTLAEYRETLDPAARKSSCCRPPARPAPITATSAGAPAATGR